MIQKNWKQFKGIFFKQCCQLICEAKTDSKPKYLYKNKYKGHGIKKEDYITDEYIEKINKLAINGENKIFAVAESRQKNINSEDGRGNPDITFFSLMNLNTKTCFECKILGNNSQYINDGIKRFVEGKYILDAKMLFYGMLGYVEKEAASERYGKLKSSINKKKKDLILKKEIKKKNSDNEVVFDTVHGINSIDKNNKKITITHILHSWENS